MFSETIDSGAAKRNHDTSRSPNYSTTRKPSRHDSRYQLYNNIDKEYSKKASSEVPQRYPVFRNRDNFQPERIVFVVKSLSPNVSIINSKIKLNK